MKLMTKYEAFKLMYTEGVKIRRNTWDDKTYLHVTEEGVVRDEGSNNYGCEIDELWFYIESEAWHVVEEPKQVPLTAEDLDKRCELKNAVNYISNYCKTHHVDDDYCIDCRFFNMHFMSCELFNKLPREWSRMDGREER